MQDDVITHMEGAEGEPWNDSPFRLDLQTVLGLVISLKLVLCLSGRRPKAMILFAL